MKRAGVEGEGGCGWERSGRGGGNEKGGVGCVRECGGLKRVGR